jgi:TonB family protein
MAFMLDSSAKPVSAFRWHESPRKFIFLAFVSASLLLPSRLYSAENVPARASVDRSGDLAVTNGMTLHVNADLGNVRILTTPQTTSPTLHYNVHVETDVPDPIGQRLLASYSLTTRETLDGVFLTGAIPNVGLITRSHRSFVERNAQFYVQFTITVPLSFNVDISTGGGDIETGDVGGRATLITQGGAITTGRIGLMSHPLSGSDRPAAKIATNGGPITLKDVNGDVDAFTAGGHIIVANIDGNAKLRTGGGHIRATKIKGTAQLETEGGNITVGEAGSFVGVRTGGGQIDFGEARGSVHAQTGGGGIRIMYVAGPMEVATSGGSICLTRVADTVHAQTSEGNITAWITPESPQGQPVRLPGASQLQSRNGDIIVFVPRNIAMTIDATVDSGGPGRIEADPSLPLNILTRAEGPVHAMASLNGGGPPLKLHTVGGKIQLQYLEQQLSLRQSLLNEEQQRLAERLNVTQISLPQIAASPLASPVPDPAAEAKGDWYDRLEIWLTGSLRENDVEFRRNLTSQPLPEYPALARRAGIQGKVIAEVRMRTDGTVTVDKIVEGSPTLADAVVAAVKNWRGRPQQIGGKNVEVVTTVNFNFTLH